MNNFNESIESVKKTIEGLNSQDAIMTTLTMYLKNLRIKHEYEASLLRTILNASSDDFTELLLKLTDGPDQVTHTIVRNIYFYMTANFGSGLLNSNLHLYQLVVSTNLFLVIPVLVGAVFFAIYYMARKWYELKKQREMSQFDYAVKQFLKTNPDMTKEEAELLMTKQVAKGLLTYIANSINAAKTAEEDKRNKLNSKDDEDSKDETSLLERFFARIRNSSVSSTANSAWMTLALVSMTSWIIFATGIITGLTIAFPISASIVVGVVAIALTFRAYKYFSAAGQRKTAQKVAETSDTEKLEPADLAELLDPAKEMKARHEQRIKDFMAVDFEGKKITLQKLYEKKVNKLLRNSVVHDKVRTDAILDAAKISKLKNGMAINDSDFINEDKLADIKRPLLSKDSDEEVSISALQRLKNSWWSKDSRIRTIVVAILGASFGFMSTSFLFAPLTNTVVAILTKAGVAATATVITALSLGVAAIVFAAIVGVYLGVYYHYARKQEVKENSASLEDITKKQTFTIDETTYNNTSKEQVMKDLLAKCTDLKESIKLLQLKYSAKAEMLPDVNNLPGYENHTYFTEMRYERSLAGKIDDVVQVVLAGLDGLGTGFFKPRANYVTSRDSFMVAVGILGLTIAIAVFHPPLLMVIIMGGIMGASFAVFKMLRQRYNQAEKADQTFLEQFDTRLEYLQKEAEYLELYRDTLVNLVAAEQIRNQPFIESVGTGAEDKSASMPNMAALVDLEDTSAATEFFASEPAVVSTNKLPTNAGTVNENEVAPPSSTPTLHE